MAVSSNQFVWRGRNGYTDVQQLGLRGIDNTYWPETLSILSEQTGYVLDVTLYWIYADEDGRPERVIYRNSERDIRVVVWNDYTENHQPTEEEGLRDLYHAWHNR